MTIIRRSALNKKAYPLAAPDQWLIFSKPWHKRIDPVFAGRLAALARSKNCKINIFSGFRTYREQMYWYRLRKGKGALKPGTSWHEFGGAVDIIVPWVRELDNAPLTEQYQLLQFGLCKPMAKGNNIYPVEDWHIQPIELSKVTDLSAKAKFYRAYRPPIKSSR